MLNDVILEKSDSFLFISCAKVFAITIFCEGMLFDRYKNYISMNILFQK